MIRLFYAIRSVTHKQYLGYLTRPPAEQTTLTLLALLKYYHEVRSLPHEPLHRAARYLIVDEAPFQGHYPELWLSKDLFRVSGHEALALSVALVQLL